MKLDKTFAAQVYIPTDGMEPFDVLNHHPVVLKTGLYDDFKFTKFYHDGGQLNWSDEKSEPTHLVYFIQREDGLVKVIHAGSGEHAATFLKPHLAAGIRAEVIECRTSEAIFRKCRDCEYGVLAFFALHHPDWRVRKELRHSVVGV